MSKDLKKGKNILLISEWNYPKKTNEVQGYYSPEKFVFPLLIEFANKNKMKLNILGRAYKNMPHDDGSDEIKFFFKSIKM